MADIVLIQTKTGIDIRNISIGLPLALLHVACVLNQNGYKIKIIDQRIDQYWWKTLIEELKTRPLCVGISAMTGMQINGGLATAKIIRKEAPAVKIIWGGVHPSLLPEQTASHPFVDLVVVGEGEYTIVEVVKAIENNKSYEDVQSVCFQKDGQIIKTLRRPLLNLNDLPSLPYHLVNVNKYFLNLYTSKNTLSLLSGRGCPHRCGYCYNLSYNFRKWRGKSAELIVNEIKILKRYGAETVDLVDDNFFLNKKRAEKVCNLLKKENIKIKLTTNCRIDYIASYDAGFLDKLRAAGFTEFFCGIESGSQSVLNRIMKDVTIEQIIRGNKNLIRAKITPIYSFMGGFPDETLEDIKKTVNLMWSLLKDNPESSITPIKYFTPFPGTELFDVCVDRGLKFPDSLEEWSLYEYNISNFKWGTKNGRKILNRILYLTYFFDGKSMERHFAKKFITKIAIQIYTKIARWRLKRHFYSFMPELYILEFLRIFFANHGK